MKMAKDPARAEEDELFRQIRHFVGTTHTCPAHLSSTDLKAVWAILAIPQGGNMGLSVYYEGCRKAAWEGSYTKFTEWRELLRKASAENPHYPGYADPIDQLLEVDDGEGQIPAEDCLAIAGRLADLLESPHLVAYWDETFRFDRGLRAAARDGQPLLFR